MKDRSDSHFKLLWIYCQCESYGTEVGTVGRQQTGRILMHCFPQHAPVWIVDSHGGDNTQGNKTLPLPTYEKKEHFF